MKWEADGQTDPWFWTIEGRLCFSGNTVLDVQGPSRTKDNAPSIVKSGGEGPTWQVFLDEAVFPYA